MTKHVLLFLGFCGAVAGKPARLAAQAEVEIGRYEASGRDLAPDGGWRSKVAAVRARRQALLRAGDMAALNRALSQPRLLAGPALTNAEAVSGTFYAPVILIHFPDFASVYTPADYDDILFGPAPPAKPYSMASFFLEASNGLLQTEGRVFAPVRTDSSSVYYENGCNGIGVVNQCPDGGQRFGNMLIAMLDSISNRPGGDTVWNQFDNDGPDGIPNSGDDDGVVDAVQFFQPLQDGACSGSPHIWAHRWVMRGWTASRTMYVTKTPRRDALGNPIPGQFLQVDNYIIQSGVGGATLCDDSQIAAIGAVVHEMGHVFGLPDLYDTSLQTQGIGDWGLMGTASFAKAHSPGSYSAWTLSELGWVTVTELTESSVVTTGPRQLTDTVFLARTKDPNEYVLIANRQSVQSDTAQMNPAFTRPKLPGLLIWLIAPDKIASSLFSNTVNVGSRQGVSLIQADGLNQLRAPGSRNRGDTGDSYPGSTGNTRYSLTTAPSARTNFGEYTGFIIDQIEQLPEKVMRFRYLKRNPSLVYPDLVGAAVKVNGSLYQLYEEVHAQGDELLLAVDAVQTVAGGRTRGTFVGWSDGGAQMHTLVSGAAPDTVRALFADEHRLKATAIGGGSVTSNVQGDLGAGIFLAEGTNATVTAVSPAGFVFAGWEGDTVAAGANLTVTISRPYDLEARFLPEQSIPAESATAEILGTPTLTASQKSYLDTFGNRNGTFDLGDYLALLHRLGLAPPAALQAQPSQDRRPAHAPSRPGGDPEVRLP